MNAEKYVGDILMNWQTRARQRLQTYANMCYSNWLASRDGKRFKESRKKGKSPYNFGFSLPDYHHDLIKALNEDDEETAKYLIGLHYVNCT